MRVSEKHAYVTFGWARTAASIYTQGMELALERTRLWPPMREQQLALKWIALVLSLVARSVALRLIIGFAWCGASLSASAAVVNTAQPYLGVTHYQVIEAFDGSTLGGPFDLPRPLVINILEINPTAAGVSFRMQPGNGADPGEVTRMTTRSFVDSIGAKIGINGDFYDTNPPYPPAGGQFFTDVVHTGVSNGVGYSSSGFNNQPIFNVSSGNVARVLRANGTGTFNTVEGVSLYNAIGGNQRLITNGVNTTSLTDPYTTALNPHTALGVTFDDRVLLMTVDGRQTDYSEGMRTDEMADLLIEHFNARHAINVDGGGSTTFVMDDSNDASQNARVFNSPSDQASGQQAGNERLVANNFAVFATPNPGYVPLPAPPRPPAIPPQPLLTGLTIFDDFEGSKGRFAAAVNASGSSRHIAATSSSSLDSQFAQRGNESLRVDIENTGDAPTAMQLRLLSGVGSPANNLHDGNKAMGDQGFVGYFLRLEPGNDPLYAAILLDDGNLSQNGLERSSFIPVVADGQWHLYQWNLADDQQWNNFSNANGGIDGANSFVDAIYLSSAPATSGGTNWSGTVWIDTVAYNPYSDLSTLDLSGDHNFDGTVDAADYVAWRKADSSNPQGYADWQENFGEPNGGGGGSSSDSHVPEPNSAFLMWGSLAALLAGPPRGPERRRWRRELPSAHSEN